MTRARQRLIFIIAALMLTASAIALALYGVSDSIIYFHSPSQLQTMTVSPHKTIRAGGLVAQGSVNQQSHHVTFTITDGDHELVVRYQGLLPDLFREGQGVIAEGKMQDNILIASRVLAKHDEQYMPPDVAAALKASGYQPPTP